MRVLVLPRGVGRQAHDPLRRSRPTRRSRSCSARASTWSTGCERRRGGKLLTDQLAVHGTEVAFCVPGESYLGCSTALYESPIRLITCRHEAGAANMAEAYGKLTGRPGICMVTRGPGATQASVGVHTAFQDSTPLILLVGQVASRRRSARRSRRSTTGGCSARLRSGSRRSTASTGSRSSSRAPTRGMRGPPGPVVLALPEDMLARGIRGAGCAARSTSCRRARRSRRGVPARRCSRSESGRRDPRRRGLDDARVRRHAGVPGGERAACGRRVQRQDALDNDSPTYAGDVGIGINPALAARVRDADVLLVVGAAARRDDDLRLHAPRRRRAAADARARASRRRGARPRLPGRAPDPLRDGAVRRRRARPARRAALARVRRGGACRLRSVAAARADARRRRPRRRASPSCASACPMRSSPTVPATTRSGSHRFWRFRGFRASSRRPAARWVTACRPRSLRRRSRPERTVDVFLGRRRLLDDGTGLATAVQYDLPIVVLVVDNGMYGTIRMHQERISRAVSPARTSSTRLRRLGRAYGAHGETVERTEDFADAFRTRPRVGSSGGSWTLRIDPEAMNPRTTLRAIRGRLPGDGAAKSACPPSPSRSATTRMPCVRATCSSSRVAGRSRSTVTGT